MTKLNRRFTLVISSIIWIIMIFVSLVLIRGNHERPNTYECFPESFQIKVNGKPITNTNINDLPNLSLSKYDKIELSRIMPNLDINDAMIVCYTSYTAMEFFLDDSKIYSYGYENMQIKKHIGAGYHHIQLPVNYQNKELKIIMTISGNFKLPYIIKNLVLCESHNAIVPIIRENLLSFAMSVFLILFGIINLVVFLILLIKKTVVKGLAYLSFASFSIGLWSLCERDFIRVFSDNLLLNNYLSYFSFYYASIPWVYMVADLKKHVGYDKWFNTIKTLQISFVILIISLHFTNLVDYKYFLTPYSIFGAFVMAFGLYVMSYKYRYQKTHEKLLFIGNFISVLYIFAQIILFYLEKWFNIRAVKIPNAFLIMIATFFLSYGYRFANNIATKKESKILRQLAYTDSLTHLGNRQSGMLKLMELDENQIDYFIILFDLNNLKTTNDTYGHSRGDALLKDFSNCLTLAFPPESVKCRLGGDEFLVIYPTEDVTSVNNAIQNFQQKINDINSTSTDNIVLEAAYGIASTKELFCFNSELIIRTADEKMYENKRKMKNSDKTQENTYAL